MMSEKIELVLVKRNGFKPLESIMVIYFKDNSSTAYSSAGLSMSFDR